MTTETLRPNASGDECNIPGQTGCSACPDHYTCVDEVVADDATTYIQNPQDYGVWLRDLYNIEASTGNGTINSVTVHARCQVTKSATGALKIALKSGTTTDESAAKDVTTSWANYSEEWTVNPDTLAAFTWAEIDSLQVGVNLQSVELRYSHDCTQVWVVVDYTTTPPLPTPARAENPLINRSLFRRHSE